MKVAVYLRQSLDREGTGLAIERQRKECRALCESRGWQPVEYVDNSVSATSRKPRPAYRQMLADIEAGKVRGVVVWDLDRLHRQPAELETFIPMAERYGLALATVTGDTDLSTDNGRLFARIKGAVARAEMERKSARQKASHRQRAAEGKPWATRRPFGFLEDAVTHHPAEAALVRTMYAEALAGATQSAIARLLNDQGVTTTLGNQWTQHGVRSLLLNPRNAGLRAHKGQVVGEGAWDALVPVETWRAVVEKFTSRPAGRGGGARKYLLAGLARCGVCDAPLRTRYTNRNARLYACPAHHVGRNAEAVDELVTGFVLDRVGRPDAADLLVTPDPDEHATVQAEIKGAREALQTLAEMFADGALTSEAFKAGNERAKKRLADAEAQLPRAEAAEVLEPLVSPGSDPAKVWADMSLARRRQAIDVLMTVKVNPTGRGSRFDPTSVEVAPR